jgi:hypothetical protein
MALVAMLALSASPALAQPAGSVEARDHVVNARRDGNYTFCSNPKPPFKDRQIELCPMAAELEGCEGLVAACKGELRAPPRTETSSSWKAILEALGYLAKMLVWLLVLAAIALIAFPLIRAILRARRDQAVADAPKPVNVALAAERPPPPEAETISDAEAALREADDHARRGELSRALSLYLAASLAALDRRGAIRLARHRTNGEYVRSCGEDAARQPLRDIVREVDKVEFGKNAPSQEAVAQVASRAGGLVRARGAAGGRNVPSVATFIAGGLFLLTLLGCNGSGGHGKENKGKTFDDPAGAELPIDVLRRSGYTVSYLTTSLAALPMPTRSENAPVLVVDVTRVPLEDESEAHLMRWVTEGGVLVLLGPPSWWPKELHVSDAPASNDHVEVITAEVYARDARVGVGRALKWADSDPIAFVGEKSVYAARIKHGQGAVIGIAGHELFTNVGVARPDNAGAFVGMIDVAMEERELTGVARGITETPTTFELHIARAEDGIPPPSNPFAALIRAGLGKGLWHALAGAVVLFLAFGIRHARARPPAPALRRAFAEHVEATGAFYGRARALGHALAAYGKFAEMRIRERIPRGADPAQFLATHAQVPPEEAARVWKRATEASAEDPPRGDELATIRDLGSMLSKALEAK